MTVSFYLQHPAAKISAILVQVTHGGMRFRAAAGVSVPTERWKRPKKGTQTSTDPKVAATLRKLAAALAEELEGKGVAAIPGTLKRIEKGVLRAARGEERQEAKGAPRPLEWLTEWTRTKGDRTARAAAARLAEYITPATEWADIDEEWAEGFRAYLDSLNFKGGTAAIYLMEIRSFLRSAARKGWARPLDCPALNAKSEDAESVYLTQEETDRLWEAELAGKYAAARDLFMLGICTASRFSDYSRLTQDNVRDGMVTITQRKTGRKVVMPASPRVSEILARNGGKAPEVSQKTLINRIRKICQDLGMDAPVTVRYTRGGRKVTETLPKWKLIGSHTARRTGCTLLYLQGVPSRQVMLISGHRSEASFRRYIRVTEEENARLLMGLDFFTRK